MKTRIGFEICDHCEKKVDELFRDNKRNYFCRVCWPLYHDYPPKGSLKHNWVDNNSKDFNRILEDKMRKCTNCGEEQVFVSTGTWMRIGQRRWEPLVGRCKGIKETNR